MASQAEIGLIGLGVMGQNLALNIADHGFRVAVYNRTPARTEAFAASDQASARVHLDRIGQAGIERDDVVRLDGRRFPC